MEATILALWVGSLAPEPVRSYAGLVRREPVPAGTASADQAGLPGAWKNSPRPPSWKGSPTKRQKFSPRRLRCAAPFNPLSIRRTCRIMKSACSPGC